jgi:hypothetical protein
MQLTIACSRQANRNRMGWAVQSTESVNSNMGHSIPFTVQPEHGRTDILRKARSGSARPGLLRRPPPRCHSPPASRRRRRPPASEGQGGTRREMAKSCKGLAMELVKCLAETDCVKVCLPLPKPAPLTPALQLAALCFDPIGCKRPSVVLAVSCCHCLREESATDDIDSMPEFSVDAASF